MLSPFVNLSGCAPQSWQGNLPFRLLGASLRTGPWLYLALFLASMAIALFHTTNIRHLIPESLAAVPVAMA